MSRGLSKLIQLGIVGIWLCLVVILVYRYYVSGQSISSLQAVQESRFTEKEEWFGIYAKNTKIGHTRTATEKIGDEYRFTQEGVTEVPGEGGTVKSTTLFSCLTDQSFRMKSFSFETRTGETFYKSRGEIDRDDVLLVFIETDKEKKTETLDMAEPPYLPITVKSQLFNQGLEKGKRFWVPVFDIFSGKTEEMIAEVQELIPVKVGINVNTAYKIKIGNNYSWLSDGGLTLKEIYNSGLMYIAETDEQAQSRGLQYIFDFLSIPVIRSDKHLSYPESLSRLKVRISGIDLSQYPIINEGRQIVRGDVLEIAREQEDMLKGKTYDLPYSGQDLNIFLNPSRFVESDHHTIIYNAKKFVAIEKNAFRLARFLTSNLYLTIGKRPMSHLRSSMEIFNREVGESNDHTVMFTSFARAGGLPTRMVGGLVYLKGHFYYHTWPEVWLDGWVAVDPTMGQFPADVTHIRFLEGDMDELASFAQAMRTLHIEVMEAL